MNLPQTLPQDPDFEEKRQTEKANLEGGKVNLKRLENCGKVLGISPSELTNPILPTLEEAKANV